MRNKYLWGGFAIATIFAIAIGWITLMYQADYYLTPSALADRLINPNSTVRVGGIISENTLKKKNEKWLFVLADDSSKINVEYPGTLPSLFKEGQNAIAEGRISKEGVLIANRILARHDQYYSPTSK